MTSSLPVPTDSDAMLTIRQLAALMGYSHRTLYEWRQADPPKGPPAQTINGRLRWRRGDVIEWLAAQPTDTQKETPCP